MDSKVIQIQVLDENGFWVGRTVFINADSFGEFSKQLDRLIKMHEFDNTYTTVRKVLYS